MRTLCLHTILSTDNGFRVCLFNQWRDCYMNGWLNKYIWSLQGEEVALCKALSPNSNPSATVSHDILSVFNSVQSVLSSSLRPHGLQHARPPCPSSSLGVYSNSRPLSRWWHLSTSSSVVPFSSCLQSFPASGSFQLSQSSHEVAKVLEFQLQYQSFQWTLRTDLDWSVKRPLLDVNKKSLRKVAKGLEGFEVDGDMDAQ